MREKLFYIIDKMMTVIRKFGINFNSQDITFFLLRVINLANHQVNYSFKMMTKIIIYFLINFLEERK